jgi:8-amino-7-oxononanoate synthase
LRAALRISEGGDDLRADLFERMELARQVLGPLGAECHFGPLGGSPILPLVLGEDKRTMAVAAALQAKGFDIRGIRPPTVPEGTSRLRIVITRNAAPDQIHALGEALREVLA